MVGSHNTFTYLKPIKWWMKLLTPFARCQTKSIIEQSKLGVRLADIRVRYNADDDKWYVCHGITRYCTLNKAIAKLYDTHIRKVRILFEGKFPNKAVKSLEKYLKLYPEIRFYEGRTKKDWKPVLSNVPSMFLGQEVGSMNTWYGKIFPWLYTKINFTRLSRRFNEVLPSNETYLFDFISKELMHHATN